MVKRSKTVVLSAMQYLYGAMNLLVKQLASFVYRIIRFIYTSRCGICNVLTQDNAIVCTQCWKNLCFISDPYCNICGRPLGVNTFDIVVCLKCMRDKPQYRMQRGLLRLNSSAKILIHKFKYHDIYHYGKYFANLIYCRILSKLDFDLIIPIPMHKRRRILRKYNHAQIMCGYLSKLSGVGTRSDVLLKQKNTKQQSLLTRSQRKSNLVGSFYVNKAHIIRGKKILLIDDVVTTGSTIKVCTKELIKAGAKEVCVAVIAFA